MQGNKGEERHSLDLLRAVAVEPDGTAVAVKEALPDLVCCTLQVLAAATSADSAQAGEVQPVAYSCAWRT